MAGKTALNKEMKHLNGAYFRTIQGNEAPKRCIFPNHYEQLEYTI